MWISEVAGSESLPVNLSPSSSTAVQGRLGFKFQGQCHGSLGDMLQGCPNRHEISSEGIGKCV